MYGKLIDGELIEAPVEINKSISKMLEQGYKPVIDTKPGYNVDTQYCEHTGYIDNGRYIKFTYKVKNIELTHDEKIIDQTDLALNMLNIKLSDMLVDLTDKQAQQVPLLFPSWEAGVSYDVGTRIEFEGVLYKTLTSHTSQSDWMPCNAPSLFAKVLVDPTNETILEWQQPDNANPYMAGDKVIYKGVIYISLIDNNVWSPSDYPAGWQETTE